MNQTVTLEGAAAIRAMKAVAEARTIWPILNGLPDEKVLELLVSATIAKEARV